MPSLPVRRWRPAAVTALLVVLLGLVLDGLTVALMLLGMTDAVAGLTALVSGRRALGLPGRRGGALALAAACCLFATGAATMPGQRAADLDASPAPSATPRPTASASSSAAPPAGRTEETTPTAGLAPTQGPTPQEAAAPQPAASARSQPGTALAAATELVVKGRAPRTGYDRDLFAYRSYDQDRNGCDVRNDVLRRDLVDLVIRPGTNGCVVSSGVLHDPYSGTEIPFVRGASTSSDVQIDHVVALSDAWQKGAQAWDVDTMREFGNDPLNLLAVDGPLNAQKSDGDTATWLPPNTAYRCPFVARQVAVKQEYGLWVTAAEQQAMVGVLERCPDERLPQRETAPLMPELAADTPPRQP